MAERRTLKSYSPALFDVAQDIIGALPLALVKRWLESEQTEVAAAELLAPYKVTGYVVSSDSVGLTALTRTRGLLDILAVINRPKEIVHAVGTAIGGVAIGIWAADNTQMFYPESVSAEELLSALLTMQREIKDRCRMRIGLGAHFGEFYLISGGLYGAAADAIEEIAENRTQGGDVMISAAIRAQLAATHRFSLVETDLGATQIGAMWRVLDGPISSGLPTNGPRYPIPYSELFYADLIAFDERKHDAAFGRRMQGKYVQRKVVVLVERAPERADAHNVAMVGESIAVKNTVGESIAVNNNVVENTVVENTVVENTVVENTVVENIVGMFAELSTSARMKDVGLSLLAAEMAAATADTPADAIDGSEVKVVGALGIYVFNAAASALRFAHGFRAALASDGIDCRIGIDAGEVLIFDLATGSKDIAGNPVNIASKLAQDIGKFGKLYLSATVHAMLVDDPSTNASVDASADAGKNAAVKAGVPDAIHISTFKALTFLAGGAENTTYEG